MSETTKVLIDAGSTVILAITLLVAIYFLTKSRDAESAAIKSEGDAALVVARANARLAESLDRFSVAAIEAASLARAQKQIVDQNALILAAQHQSLTQVGESLELHNITSTRRDLATIERDKVATAAIEALTGRIQLVVQKDTNALMLQIEMAFDDFLKRLSPDQKPRPETPREVEKSVTDSAPGESKAPEETGAETKEV